MEHGRHITVRLSIEGKPSKKLWNLYGVNTPVRYVTVNFLPIEQNILQVQVHLDNIKVLRLAKLIHYKKAWKLSKICGFGSKDMEFMTIWLPQSWKADATVSAPINNFIRYLLDKTWKDF